MPLFPKTGQGRQRRIGGQGDVSFVLFSMERTKDTSPCPPPVLLFSRDLRP